MYPYSAKALPSGLKITSGKRALLRCDVRSSYLRLYYQFDPSCLSTCIVTVHALLHIADSINAVGPVWTVWAYPMERFCGQLQRAVKGRHFVWAAIDNWALRMAQVAHVRYAYHLSRETYSFDQPSKPSTTSLANCEECTLCPVYRTWCMYLTAHSRLQVFSPW